jgi:hypothetical protein
MWFCVWLLLIQLLRSGLFPAHEAAELATYSPLVVDRHYPEDYCSVAVPGLRRPRACVKEASIDSAMRTTMKSLLVWLFLTAAAAGASDSAAPVRPRPDLTGLVSAQDGAPLPGATVLIYTAGPTEGRGTL